MKDLPIEIQLQVFDHVFQTNAAIPSLTKIVRLSKLHHSLVNPLLYRKITIHNECQLRSLDKSLRENGALTELVQSIFVRGPQGKKMTGRELMTSLATDDEDEDEDDDSTDDDLNQQFKFKRPIGHKNANQLEPGIEGEGQEATIDEIESFIDLCTNILRLCAPNLRSVGFIDCIPWFMTPADYLRTDIQLPSCDQFAGVTMGAFGLLPYLHHTKGYPKADRLTFLTRVHLIGADFGSFALQRALPASPTRNSLTHLHITAPTLYKLDHHDNLVRHIRNILENCPQLCKISVGILSWYSIPPLRKNEEHQQHQQRHEKCKPIQDDRLEKCRQIYEKALPEALELSRRNDVRALLIDLPFVQGSPFGFADWFMGDGSKGVSANYEGQFKIGVEGNYQKRNPLKRWLQRDFACLPDQVNRDGIPAQSVWNIEPEKEWIFSPIDGIILCGSDKRNLDLSCVN